MNTITVTGVPPWDGSYEIDFEAEFTTREWGLIKRLSGYMPLTVDAGFDGGDPELLAALAVVAVIRNGRVDHADAQTVYDRILDAPYPASLTFNFTSDDEEEADGRPPPGSSNGNTGTSGDGSKTSSDRSEQPTPADFGPPSSAGAVSAPARSAT